MLLVKMIALPSTFMVVSSIVFSEQKRNKVRGPVKYFRREDPPLTFPESFYLLIRCHLLTGFCGEIPHAIGK
jgi:hypothetical protein